MIILVLRYKGVEIRACSQETRVDILKMKDITHDRCKRRMNKFVRKRPLSLLWSDEEINPHIGVADLDDDDATQGESSFAFVGCNDESLFVVTMSNFTHLRIFSLLSKFPN